MADDRLSHVCVHSIEKQRGKARWHKRFGKSRPSDLFSMAWSHGSNETAKMISSRIHPSMWTPLPAAHYILTRSLIFCILLLCYLTAQRTHLPQHHFDNVSGNGWFQCSPTAWPVILSYHTYHSYRNWTQYNEISFLKHNKMAQNVSSYYDITLGLDWSLNS